MQNLIIALYYASLPFDHKEYQSIHEEEPSDNGWEK